MRGSYKRNKTVNRNTRTRESPALNHNQQISGAGCIDLNTSSNYIAPEKERAKSRGLGARILITKNEGKLNLPNFQGKKMSNIFVNSA
jgi:hypothetical protein